MKVDSGVAVTARTVKDSELEDMAVRAAQLVGIRGVANVQFKRDVNGLPRLMEINPRFPGTMALTVLAGANLPQLRVDIADGKKVDPPKWREIAIVRTLAAHEVDPGAFDALRNAPR
jgi:carbamoyl-phosphate synthase large subunit